MTDKAYVKVMHQRIRAFLEDRCNEVPFQWDDQMLFKNPGKASFTALFQYIFGWLEPDFVVTKIEEDVSEHYRYQTRVICR